MANTFQTRALAWHAPTDAYLAYATEPYLEAATQTFPKHSPVKIASGFIAEWVSVADADIFGFTEDAGSNGTAGANTVNVVLALPELVLEANFLDAAAADEVLLQADLGGEHGLTKGANLLGTGLAGWYFQDGGTGAVITRNFHAAPALGVNAPETQPVAGDTNARVWAQVKPGVSAWF